MRKRLPNWLTAGRILLSLSLGFTVPLSAAFLLLYALCGVTDMLDGYLARKWQVQTPLGARLDTMADMVMLAVALFLLWHYLPLTETVVVWFAVVASVKLFSILVWFIRTRRLLAHHSGWNKAVGLLLFLYPFVLALWASPWGLFVLLALASIAALAECYHACVHQERSL